MFKDVKTRGLLQLREPITYTFIMSHCRKGADITRYVQFDSHLTDDAGKWTLNVQIALSIWYVYADNDSILVVL